MRRITDQEGPAVLVASSHCRREVPTEGGLNLHDEVGHAGCRPDSLSKALRRPPGRRLRHTRFQFHVVDPPAGAGRHEHAFDRRFHHRVQNAESMIHQRREICLEQGGEVDTLHTKRRQLNTKLISNQTAPTIGSHDVTGAHLIAVTGVAAA